MTEEIMIDGIDVSGCEHYWNTHNLELCKINFDNNYYSNGLPLAEKCSFKDCYYKRMKRLEAENAELKEENFKLDFKLGQIDIKKITLVENRQLAEENEKLKEKYQEELTFNKQLQEWQDEDLRQIKELTVKRNKLFGENAILLEENKKLNEKLYTLTKAYYDEQRERIMLGYKLEKIKEYANQLKIFVHIKEDLLNILEGAEDE